MVERILVPLDGSQTGESILPLVQSVARRASAEILLLRVEDLTLLEPDSGFQDRALAYAREYLDRTSKTLANEAGLRTRGLVRIGRADRVIVEVAREEQASLIGMATHGFTGSLSACFGSVTESVLRTTPVPLLAFRPFARPPGTARLKPTPDRFRSIVLATDGGDFSLAGAEALAGLAKVFGSRVDLLHVLLRRIEEAVDRPEVRRDVLDRLLALNHQRYAEEVKAGLHNNGGKKTKGKKRHLL